MRVIAENKIGKGSFRVLRPEDVNDCWKSPVKIIYRSTRTFRTPANVPYRYVCDETGKAWRVDLAYGHAHPATIPVGTEMEPMEQGK